MNKQRKILWLSLSILVFVICLNAKTESGQDLFAPIEKGQSEDVKKLIDAGADVHAKTNEGETLLQRANSIHRLEDRSEIIKILKEARAIK